MVRFAAFLVVDVAAVDFFAVGVAELLIAGLFAAILDFAQRALCAAAILSRASALNVCRLPSLPAKLAAAGRPGLRFSLGPVPSNSARACCSRDISASISTRMSFVFMVPPVSMIDHGLSHTGLLAVRLYSRRSGKEEHIWPEFFLRFATLLS